MSSVFDYLSELTTSGVGASWRWFNALNREEWIIVLAVCCVLGFLCLRGYGSRSNY